MPPVDSLVAFGTACALSLALTPAMRWIARHTTALAKPTADRWHRTSIPLLGGVAIWIASSGGVAAAADGAGHVPLALLCGSLMFIVGLIDDFVPLKPSTKLTAQIAVGCTVVMAGLVRPWTGSPLADALLTIAWVVAITNAFNLIDNMDGLCAGIAAIAGLSLSLSEPAAPSATLHVAAALAGACAGFLVFNFNPASIFMGDSGSLFIGATLAVLALSPGSRLDTHVLAALASPALIMLIPVFDVAFVTLARTLSSRAATTGGRDHTSHRLVALGLSERQAVLLLYGLAALGGASAVALARGHVWEGNLLLLPVVLGVVLLAMHVARVPAYGEDDYARLRGRRFTPLLVEFTYKRRVLEVLLDFLLVIASYYAAYLIRFDRDFAQYYDLFVRSLPLVITCQLSSFFIAGVYRSVWRYVSLADIVTYARGVLLGSVSSVLVLLYAFRFEGYSRTVFIIHSMVLLLLVAASRASFRLLQDLGKGHPPGALRALIYGAGEGGVLVMRELRSNHAYPYQPLAFIDDDPRKHGKRVGGLQVAGGIGDLPEVAERYEIDLVIISTGKIDPDRLHEMQRHCAERGHALLQFEFRLQAVEARGD